jgi:hypothetical protein
VTFYAESASGVSLEIIFDLDNKGRLCDKPSKTVVLKTPGESDNPWIYFLDGSFYLALGDKQGMEYGSYFYTDIVVDKVERTIAVFARKGAGEKTIGSLGGEGTIFSMEGKNISTQIGECQFSEITTPAGEKRTVRVSRFINPVSPWAVALGDKIYQVEKNGKLVQKGWIEWRKIATPEGEALVILMTKGMDKNSRWAGRYDGILYVDGGTS